MDPRNLLVYTGDILSIDTPENNKDLDPGEFMIDIKCKDDFTILFSINGNHGELSVGDTIILDAISHDVYKKIGMD